MGDLIRREDALQAITGCKLCVEAINQIPAVITDDEDPELIEMYPVEEDQDGDN